MMTDTHAPTALIAVDVQRDFLPGGSLAVHDGDAVIGPLVAAAAGVTTVIATRDFHPPDHSSFVAQGGPWPPHCVIGTPGAWLAPEIDSIARLVVSKGTEPGVDALSGFDGTGLAGILRGLGIDHLLIGGLATDYCVRATALDALGAGFAATLLLDAVRAVDVNPGDGARAIEEMRSAGVTITRQRS